MYWPHLLATKKATRSLFHLDNEHQWSINNFSSCIMGNLCGAGSQTSINKVLAASIGRYARDIPATAFQTVTTYFIYNAPTQCSAAF